MNIHPPAPGEGQPLFNPWRPWNERFLRATLPDEAENPRFPFDEKVEEEEESSDGLKLLRRFVAYLVKRGRRGFFFTGLRFVLFSFFLSSSSSSSFSFIVFSVINGWWLEKSQDSVSGMDSFLGRERRNCLRRKLTRFF